MSGAELCLHVCHMRDAFELAKNASLDNLHVGRDDLFYGYASSHGVSSSDLMPD